jgi:putative endonuclease
MAGPETRWSVYVLRCGDGSLYTGIATDVPRRVAEHGSGAKGARYLRGRGPLQLVLQSEVGDRGLATRAELRIKRLSKYAKEELIASKQGLEELLSELYPPEENTPP